MAKIKIDGLEDLEKKLKKDVTMKKVRETVRANGRALQRKIQDKADFKGHYEWVKGKGKVFKNATGATKGSVGLEIKDGGLTAESGPTTEYSPYVEYGTRFMSAQPFIRPALEEQAAQFKSDMQELVR